MLSPEILTQFFREVYFHSSPAVDYLIQSKCTDPDWFQDFYVSKEYFEALFNRYTDYYKMSEREINGFRFSAYLGPSPRFSPKNSSLSP